MLDRPLPADVVIDTSSLASILFSEPMGPSVRRALDRLFGPLLCAANLTELLLVVEGRAGHATVGDVHRLLDRLEITVVPVDEPLARSAHEAWTRFGKGNHRARLNYGDCFAYATAAHWELPLLCVGDDFAQTDLELVPLG